MWLFVNQLVDNDEKLEKMCPDCREEVTSKHKCIRCGKEIPNYDMDDEDGFVNPNFDEEEYKSKSIM